MARTKNVVNKSEEIRQLLTANPKMTVKEVVASLKERGLKVIDNLVYFIKGKMKGRRGRKKKAHQMVAKVAATGTSIPSPRFSKFKVKDWANQVGGMKKLKALVDALSE